MLRKVLVFLLTAALLVPLGGCGVKNKINEKVTEKVTEKIAEGVINKTGGGEAKIDLDDNKITIKTKEGEEITFGGTEWPGERLGGIIPEFKKGNVVHVQEDSQSCLVALENVKKGDFEDYLSAVKQVGFTEDESVATYDESTIFIAGNGKGTLIHITMDLEAEELMIAVTKEN